MPTATELYSNKDGIKIDIKKQKWTMQYETRTRSAVALPVPRGSKQRFARKGCEGSWSNCNMVPNDKCPFARILKLLSETDWNQLIHEFDGENCFPTGSVPRECHRKQLPQNGWMDDKYRGRGTGWVTGNVGQVLCYGKTPRLRFILQTSDGCCEKCPSPNRTNIAVPEARLD